MHDDWRLCPKCNLLHLPERCHYDDFIEALGGFELTPREDRFLRWLAGADTELEVVQLLERLRAGQMRPLDPAQRAAQLVARAHRRGHLEAGAAAALTKRIATATPNDLRAIVAAILTCSPRPAVLSIVRQEAYELLRSLSAIDGWKPTRDCLHRGDCTSPDRWGCVQKDAFVTRVRGRRQWRCNCGPCHDAADAAG